MNSIIINHNHNLGHETACTKVDSMLDDLKQKYNLKIDSKSSSIICFSGSGISGNVDIYENEIQVTAKLSFLMSAMKPLIETELKKELEEHFS